MFPRWLLAFVAALGLAVAVGLTLRGARHRTAHRDVRVTMYTTSWCPVCKRARAWMQANDQPFDERDIEADPAAQSACRALNPQASVPTWDIDGEVQIGFDPTSVQRAIDRASERNTKR